MKMHEELSLEDLATVGGGCRKRHCDPCEKPSNPSGGLAIEINLKGFLPGGCYGSTAGLPDIGALPGAEATTTTTLPGAEAATTAAPDEATLGTALPGV